jgi:hypothetical protein
MDRDELIERIPELAYPKLSSDLFDPLVYRLHGTQVLRRLEERLSWI